MPFTVSHAAAALPLRVLSRRLPLDALVVGTMSPDFEYVLRLAIRGRFAHTPAGVVLFCLPVSLLVLALFRGVVRPALLPLFPAGLAARLRPDPASRQAAPIVTAVLLGAATHVLWDGFTHSGGWAVALRPGLRAPAAALGTGRPWYNLLQHMSTLAGGAVLLLWAAAWLRSVPGRERRFAPGQLGRALRVLALLAGAAAAAGIANGLRAAGSGPEWVLGYAAVGAMAGLALAALAYGTYARLRTDALP